MITSLGNKKIGSLLASYLATHIGIGVSSSNNSSLGFQVYSEPIELSLYNEVTGELVFACSIPNKNEIEISEISLCLQGGLENEDYIVCDFTPGEQDWIGTLISEDNSKIKIGTHALVTSTALGPGINSYETPIAISDSRPTDVISLAGTVPVNTQITVKFLNTDTDYLSHTFTPTANGTYGHYSFNLSEMIATGQGSFDSCTAISILSNNQITIDAVAVRRVAFDKSVIAIESVTPFRSKAGEVTEVEFKMVTG